MTRATTSRDNKSRGAHVGVPTTAAGAEVDLKDAPGGRGGVRQWTPVEHMARTGLPYRVIVSFVSLSRERGYCRRSIHTDTHVLYRESTLTLLCVPPALKFITRVAPEIYY